MTWCSRLNTLTPHTYTEAHCDFRMLELLQYRMWISHSTVRNAIKFVWYLCSFRWRTIFKLMDEKCTWDYTVHIESFSSLSLLLLVKSNTTTHGKSILNRFGVQIYLSHFDQFAFWLDYQFNKSINRISSSLSDSLTLCLFFARSVASRSVCARSQAFSISRTSFIRYINLYACAQMQTLFFAHSRLRS